MKLFSTSYEDKFKELKARALILEFKKVNEVYIY
jgi:hypothetical protein